jgi:hypothetical protein
MLGLLMVIININLQGWKDLSIRSTTAGEVTPKMTWFVWNRSSYPASVSPDSLFDGVRSESSGALCCNEIAMMAGGL